MLKLLVYLHLELADYINPFVCKLQKDQKTLKRISENKYGQNFLCYLSKLHKEANWGFQIQQNTWLTPLDLIGIRY